MIFWRKKTNQADQEREEREDKIVHHPREPDLEPNGDNPADIDAEFAKHELNETESEIIEDLEVIPQSEGITLIPRRRPMKAGAGGSRA